MFDCFISVSNHQLLFESHYVHINMKYAFRTDYKTYAHLCMIWAYGFIITFLYISMQLADTCCAFTHIFIIMRVPWESNL